MHVIFGLIFLVGLISLVVPLKFLGISSRGMALLVVGASLGLSVIYTVITSSSQSPSSSQNLPAGTSKVPALDNSTSSSELSANASSSNWRYDEQQDKMRNQTTRYAALDSDNKLTFDFPYGGGSTGALRQNKEVKFGKDVILEISKGQFLCSFEGCIVHAKFDNGPIQSFSAGESSDGSSNVVFIRNYAGFLKPLRKSKSLTIEAEYYQAGWPQFDLSPAGLKW